MVQRNWVEIPQAKWGAGDSVSHTVRMTELPFLAGQSHSPGKPAHPISSHHQPLSENVPETVPAGRHPLRQATGNPQIPPPEPLQTQFSLRLPTLLLTSLLTSLAIFVCTCPQHWGLPEPPVLPALLALDTAQPLSSALYPLGSVWRECWWRWCAPQTRWAWQPCHLALGCHCPAALPAPSHHH